MPPPPPAGPTGSPGQSRRVPLARELDGTYPLVVIRTDDEESVREELFAAVPSDILYRRWTAVQGLGDARIQNPPVPDTEHPAGALAWLAMRSGSSRSVNVFYDLSTHLAEARTLRAFKEAVAAVTAVFGVIVLVERDPRLPAEVESEVHRWELPQPDRDELEKAVRAALRELKKTRPLTVEVTRSMLESIIRSLRGLTRRQAERVILATAAQDDRFDASDLEQIVVMKRNTLGDLGGVLEFVQAPVAMDQIGGLRRLKRWLVERSKATSPDAEAFGIRPPRGVLLLGAQGAGKSLAAKAIATAWCMPLLRLDASALYDKFVGESERKLRDSLAQADRMAPAVLWIDEIEKGFASAASQSSDGGLSRRMFGTLLTWMQERTAPTFLAATANDIASLPPELLRKGRFDEVFFVDLPPEEIRREILAIHLRKRRQDPKALDLAAAAKASDGFSGAELEAAVESALHAAFAADSRPLASDDLLQAIRGSPPLSVLMAERMAELRAWAANRCVPAD